MKRITFSSFIKTSLLLLTLPTTAFSQNWVEQDNMKRVRFEASSVQYKDDIYVFNGFGFGIRIEPTVEKYDAGTQKWSLVGNTSVAKGNAVTHNGIVRTGNEVWIIGGRVGSHPGKVSNKVWVFNLDSKKWTAGPSLPVPVAAGGAAVVNNKIHWFGGIDEDARCDVASHFVYDLNLPSAGWQNITNVAGMPVPRNHFSTAVHNGLIYAVGGQHGHDGCPGKGAADVALVHAFNPATNKWVQKKSLPTKQSHAEPSTFVYGDAIYMIGGEFSGAKIYRYDPSKDNWDTLANLPKALLAPVARVVDDRLMVASGGAPNYVFPSNKVYSTSMRPLLLDGADVIDQVADPVSVQVVSQTVEQVVTTKNEELHTVVLEAEYYDTSSSTNTHQWVATNRANASNNAAMVTTPDYGESSESGSTSPMLGYFAHFEASGQWYVWVRGWGDTNSNGEGGSDSLHVGLNGALSTTADKVDKFPVGWNWSNHTRDGARAVLNIPSNGIHVVNLWMREDGLAVDKIILSNDPAYTPYGIGPVRTDGSAPAVQVSMAGQSVSYGSLPVCASAVSDPDGDGYGWENDQSCVVALVPGSSEPLSVPVQTDKSVLPVCLSAGSDVDGDGYGWEQNASCVVNNEAATITGANTTAPMVPTCVSATSDSDGDGWGWENQQSCLVR